MTNVYKDVKKNYKSAEHLMLCTTKAYLCNAFMTWTEMDDLNDDPVNFSIPHLRGSKEQKRKFIETTIGNFVEQYVLSEFDVEKAKREDMEKRERENRERQSQNIDGKESFKTGKFANINNTFSAIYYAHAYISTFLEVYPNFVYPFFSFKCKGPAVIEVMWLTSNFKS